jgi:DNA invertase Pin-like site-specific DNA recombinase
MTKGNDGPFVAYYRVSTERQGESGLGLEAQREAVSRFLGPTSLLAKFTEIESGKRHTNRPELLKAIELCRRQKAMLVIAKLDRLARNVHFISGLMETGVEFVAADMPQANRLTIHILAAFAEHEREAISQRTKGALQAARKRGTQLGNPRWAESVGKARQVKDPIPPASQLIEMMSRHRAEGMTLRAIAAQLNGLGLRTPKGSQWYASTIRKAMVPSSLAAQIPMAPLG